MGSPALSVYRKATTELGLKKGGADDDGGDDDDDEHRRLESESFLEVIMLKGALHAINFGL